MTAPKVSTASPLAQSVTALWGVGSERAAQLARLGIHTVEDLLLHRPRRYEDRRQFRPINRLSTGEASLTRGTVAAMGVKTYRKGTKSVFELILDDGTGRLHCRWWNLPFMENYFEVGNDVLVYGKQTGLKPRIMDHPETEVVEEGEENSIHMGRIVPVYPLTEGVQQRWLRGLIWRTLDKVGQAPAVHSTQRAMSHANVQGDETMPAVACENSTFNIQHTPRATALPSRADAIRLLHCPETLEEAERARQRLALDEFVALQRQFLERRERFESKARGLLCRGDNHLIKPFLAQLGFTLNDAQTRVLREIRQDMGGAYPMRRLLQGDVGSGKTVVAACTTLMALESGFSVALMAPTEILAEQHFNSFQRWLESLGVLVTLRTGGKKTSNIQHSTTNAEVKRSAASLQEGTLFIGTHALLTERFDIPKLGLVIIDEQHKFGVAHREDLVRKGSYPHLLIMTATPIPRSLGLTLYGDLDLSVIDQMPADRGRIRTHVRSRDKLAKVWEFVKGQIETGRQAYVVYPRVEETDGGLTRAVKEEFGRIQSALAPHPVAMLHGRLRAQEKSTVMEDFRVGRVKALVATSLVEVGLDVPNATAMVIEDADRFGLAQLHQLRGRIGRGAHESHCILVAGKLDEPARERLKILEETNDGFAIAEADLRLRGPGELLGQQQSGALRLRFGSLFEDGALVEQARAIVMGQSPVGSS